MGDLFLCCVLLSLFQFLPPVYNEEINLIFDGNMTQSTISAHDKVVVCYVGTWATYRPHEGAYNIENIDPTLCTHIIYTFSGLNSTTNEIRPLDPYLDLEEDYGKGWFKKFNKLKEEHGHLKVLLAIGGWNEGSQNYSIMAKDSATRAKFIDSAVKFVRKYGFDGLDLDWEFPARRGGLPEDKKHFTLLVKELRKTFDKYGLMLTAALGASKDIAKNAYDLRELSRLLDHVHIMCYDYYGSWDNKTGHNAPLYNAPDKLSVQSSVDYFLSQGVNPKKLVLGLPLYGRTFLLNGVGDENGLGESAEEKGFQGPFTREDGFLGYNEICKELKSSRGAWKTYYDQKSHVPYMKNGAKWVSFDNPDSLQEKVRFAMSRGLKGAMVWSIDTEDFRGTCGGSHYPLLRAINYAFAQKSPKPGSGSTDEDNSIDAGASLYGSTLALFLALFALTYGL